MKFYIEEGQHYRVGFEGGANTFTDDELVAMTIKDSMISIYGITPTALISTALTDGSEQTFDATRVNFTNEPSQLDQADYTTEIESEPFLRGQFNGWMEITDPNSTIFSPLSVSSGPYILAPMFLVLTGVCTSVCLWEIIRFLKYRANLTGMKSYNGRLSQIQKTLEQQITADSKLSSGQREDMNQSIRELEQYNYLRRRTGDGIWPTVQNSVANYILRNERSRTTLFNIGVIEFISALFGIAVGLLVVYNNIITSNYLVIDSSTVVVLFGIGLGAGSLKELVDK
jgi:hypothetical protein